MEKNLQNVFVKALDIDASKVIDELTYGEIPEWDSVAHMALIAAIEEEFDIMIDAEDVIEMSSFAKAKSIVAKYI